MSIRRGLLVALLPAASLMPLTRAVAQDAQVVFERTGYRLTSLGARVAVAARVFDGRRRAVPNAPIAWRIQDPEVASVTALGEVVSRRTGRTRVWAVSGRDSAFALILVDQWAAKFTFNPPVIRFNAVDERRPLQVQARDASGNVIPGIRSAVACRAVNERVATLGANGQVQSRSSGVTYVRCADRGVADSVRVEVRQRPVRAAIADKGLFAQRTVGDTFQIRMNAADSEGRTIADARPTWASLEPRIVNIDPLSGRGRAVGVGDVKIVAQVGDITDTVTVSVALAPGTIMPPTITDEASAAATAAPIVKASLRILAPALYVGDTLNLVEVAVKEAGGADGDANSVRFRSTDTTTVKYVGGARIAGLKVGTAYIVGNYGGMSDSALVNVRAKGGTTSIAAAGTSNFVRPSYDTAAADRRNRTQLDSARRAILQASPIKVGVGRYVALSALAAQASHATHVSDAIIESRTGLIYGGRAAVAPFRKLTLNGDFLTGSLVGEKTARVEDMKVTEAGGELAFTPWSAFTLRAGYTLRAQSTETAVIQWSFASVGALTRLQFVGGRIATYAGMSILPLGRLKTDTAKTKTQSADPTSLSGDTGIEIQTGYFSAVLSYYVERFTFPIQGGNQRKDEYSMLRLRLGFRAGR